MALDDEPLGGADVTAAVDGGEEEDGREKHDNEEEEEEEANSSNSPHGTVMEREVKGCAHGCTVIRICPDKTEASGDRQEYCCR